MKRDYLREIFCHPFKRYIAPIVIAAAVTLLALFSRGFDLLICYMDALSVGGMVTVLIGALVLLTSFGAFDTMGYSISSWRMEKRKYRDLYEYSLAKGEKHKKDRFGFVPYVLVGVVFLLAAFIIKLAGGF